MVRRFEAQGRDEMACKGSCPHVLPPYGNLQVLAGTGGKMFVAGIVELVVPMPDFLNGKHARTMFAPFAHSPLPGQDQGMDEIGKIFHSIGEQLQREGKKLSFFVQRLFVSGRDDAEGRGQKRCRAAALGSGRRSEEPGEDARPAQQALRAIVFGGPAYGPAQVAPQGTTQHGAFVSGKRAIRQEPAGDADREVFHGALLHGRKIRE